MRIRRKLIEERVYGAGRGSRFTQDSPVMPDVWFGYGESPGAAQSLLIEPRRGVPPGRLNTALRRACEEEAGEVWASATRVGRIAYDESFVTASLSLAALVRAALPLSGWWDTHAGRLGGLSRAAIERALAGDSVPGVNEMGVWLLRLVGPLAWAAEATTAEGEGERSQEVDELPEAGEYSGALARLLRGLRRPQGNAARREPLLWAVNRNRPAKISVWAGSRTVKADAATRLFSLRCEQLTWAILDTGVDATHPAFRLRDARGRLVRSHAASRSRVLRSYDFTGIRQLLHEHADDFPGVPGRTTRKKEAELTRRLVMGQAIDWEILEPLLRIDHGRGYRPPQHPHGTHVAGILAADWRASDPGYDAHEEESMQGVCPTIRVFDLRVLDAEGHGEEFSVLAALQFVRHLNGRSRRPIVQGVNLSLAIPHDVANYACGRTPVCQEAERLHDSGVVVVAAAGNEGYVQYLTTHGENEAYRNISITDPGNAGSVITVGATHRKRPHTYGVSYFSSRGPTGDGRVKPDLVAPGEKIHGPVPGDSSEIMDGTSMAAPFVSGCAALVMSRHPEFIGEPSRIKQLLADTATDLGREHYFQGAGLVDVCRALQSV
jgi:serine protease AprX